MLFRKHPVFGKVEVNFFFFTKRFNASFDVRGVACARVKLRFGPKAAPLSADGGLQPGFMHRGHFIAAAGGNTESQVPRFGPPVFGSEESLRRWKLLLQSDLLRTPGVDSAQPQSPAEVLHVVDQCIAAQHEDVLLRLFNEQIISDSVVQFLRLLTSAHLQIHEDFFCNFVEAPDLKVYCRQEVEVMAMECDHVDILALSQALDVGIHIVSMEGNEQQLVHHVIPEGVDPSVHLLYQASHYNILYQRTCL
uniref:OTU deubiquitinase, ubiquitin aldehyde binding 2 n=1 Tax=Poecilia latipinna TaxID=48699 RepID=A0A3B3TNX7_9TELE